MNQQRSFAIQTFMITLLLMAALLGTIYYFIGDAIIERNLPIPIFGAGGVIALLLWLLNLLVGRRLIGSAVDEATAAADAAASRAAKKRAVATPSSPPAKPTPPPKPSSAAAIQMLSILQRKGRLIDFLQEDLTSYDDAQIGAAVRTIHQGCKEALAQSVQLEPVYSEEEGSQITVPVGFDANAVRLSGNVSGNPPFKGQLQHRGWRVAKITLPQQVGTKDDEMILAPAEVEVSG